jgi:WG repeat protein
MEPALRWALVAALAALLVVVAALAWRRAGGQAASAQEPQRPPPPLPTPPPPPAPKVLPGDHTGKPLFPAVDPARKLWGYIDVAGVFVIAPQYSAAEPFSEGLAFVVDSADGRLIAIDANNREQFALANPLPTGWIAPEGGFCGGRALVVVQGTAKGSRYTYVKPTGELLGPPRFWPAHPFADGLAAVAVDGRWGFLDPDGAFAIPLGYSEVFDFHEGLAPVVRKKRMGYIDRHGHEVIPARYELALEFGDGLAPVQPGSPARGDATEMGYIDRTGKLVIKPRFVSAQPFSEGRARVLVNLDEPQRWGFIDVHGTLVVPARYDQADDFHGGYAAVRAGLVWGYVDRDGKEVIAPTFDVAGDFDSGLARVSRRGASGPVPRNVIREGYVDPTGKWVYAWEREDAMRDHVIPAPPPRP